MSSEISQNSIPANRFQTTRWSMVYRAGDTLHRDQTEALEQLCQTYHPAIISYLRCKGHSLPDAEDYTQQFFLQLFNKDILQKANQYRGRFRSFLLTCLKNFVNNEIKYQNRKKRSGSYAVNSIDSFEEASLSDSEPTSLPDQAYDIKWANTVVDTALLHLQENWKDQNKPFSTLSCYLVASKQAPPFSDVAEKLGVTESALKSSVHRLRVQYGKSIRSVIADTVSDHSQIEDELKNLLIILSES